MRSKQRGLHAIHIPGRHVSAASLSDREVTPFVEDACRGGPTVPEHPNRRGRAMSHAPTMVNYAALLLIFLVLTSVGELRALDPRKQIGQYGHDTWTPERGLLGEAVYQILQSKDGYLWIRTGSGLSRFDGVRFTAV